MIVDTKVKVKALVDVYVVCHFGLTGHEGPYYLKENGKFSLNLFGEGVRHYGFELPAQQACKEINNYFTEIGHELGGKCRVCQIAIHPLSLRDVEGEDEDAHFTPRKKVSQIAPACFDQVSPEDLMDDFEPPSQEQLKEFEE